MIEVFLIRTTAFELGARGRRLLKSGQLVVHRLDGMAQIDQVLSRGLSPVPQTAAAQLRQRLASPGAELTRQWSDALRSDQRARQLHIERVPAVVFDGATIVYGAPSLDAAWSHRRAAHQEAP